MLKKINSILFLSTCSIILASCSNSFPSAFWKKFHKNLIIKSESNQGLWGGTRKIHWKTKSTEPFSENEILDFASKNDWKQVDSFTINENTTNDSTFTEPISDDYSFDLLRSEVLSKKNISRVEINYIYTLSEIREGYINY